MVETEIQSAEGEKRRTRNTPHFWRRLLQSHTGRGRRRATYRLQKHKRHSPRGNPSAQPLLIFGRTMRHGIALCKSKCLSRKKYRLTPFGRCCVLPEGGTNEEALRGCEEWGNELQKTSFDYVCLAAGTGGTLGGIVRSLPHQTAVGIPVLKGNFLEDVVKSFAPDKNFKMLHDYHFGGYAKSAPELQKFISDFSHRNIPLEPVYSGKMLFGVMDAIDKGFFDRGSTVLAIHTGGLMPT